VPTAGVAAVGVLPTHRRRGALTGMMAATLDDAERRGEPVAALWASEASIYGRFGFGVAAFGLDLRIARRRARLLPARVSGRPSLAGGRRRGPPRRPGLYDAARVSDPGLMSRTADWWRTRRLADGSAGGPPRPAPRRARARRSGRRIRALPPPARPGRGPARASGRAGRGARHVGGRHGGALAVSSSTSTSSMTSWPCRCQSTTRCRGWSRTSGPSRRASSTPSGCACSTSPRRSRRGRTRPTTSS
jgi:hypothetical protein